MIFPYFLSGRAKFLLLSSLLFSLLPSSLWAIDLGDKVQVHGFLTQGYLDTNGNNFLGDTENGLSDFREIGVNINAQITDKFRLGGQALYCHFSGASNGNLRSDWVVAEYHFTDPFGVRMGKVKMPMGLYNMERDSDFLRPLIFLPQSIYDETRRDSWQAHWGGEVYGNLPLGKWGDVDYQLFGGRIDYDDDSLATLAVGEIVLRENDTNDPAAEDFALDALTRDNDYVYGAALFYSSSLPGLRGALTILGLDEEARIHNTVVTTEKTKSKIVAAVEYSWQEWSLTAEYAETDRTQTQFGLTTLDGASRSFYFLLSYSPVEELTFSVLYDEYYRLKKNRHEPVGRRNIFPWRKDVAAALRYDITDNWTFKAEWHIIDGTAFYMTYFNPEGTERYWQYGALKLTFNF